MSPTPRDTIAGCVFNDLRNKARREGRRTDELITNYVLERFLDRLGRSELSDCFILKGGLLLAYYEARRHTRDLDLLGRAIPNQEGALLDAILCILRVPFDDGVEFDAVGVRIRPIRDEDEYGGLRVIVPARIGKSQGTLRIDVSFGDPVTPGPRRIAYPTILDTPPIQLLAYPVESILAEKLVTAVERGAANSRVRDYADIWRLSDRPDLLANDLQRALHATREHRGLRPALLAPVVSELVARQRVRYASWRSKQGIDGEAYPEEFAEVVDKVIAFADPLLAADVSGSKWDRETSAWTPADL